MRWGVEGSRRRGKVGQGCILGATQLGARLGEYCQWVEPVRWGERGYVSLRDRGAHGPLCQEGVRNGPVSLV